MRVVLIFFRENYTPVVPMGILYIGTMLRNAGCDVRIIDSFPSSHRKNLDTIRDFNPDLIGVSVLTTGFQVAHEYTVYLRQENKNSKICWGGVHATALPEEVLEDSNIDFVVVGEAEFVMLDVCDRLSQDMDLSGIRGVVYRDRNKKIVDNGRGDFIQDLDILPIPDRSLLVAPSFKWYLSPPGILRGKFYQGVTTMYASRGCPYQCIFCASKIVHGAKIRRRSVENVLEEMVYLRDNHAVKGIYFNDDTFASDRNWLDDFCRSIVDKKVNMFWGCQTRADIAGELSVLEMLKRAGCVQVDIGCESGSDRILKILKKGITQEMIARSFSNLKKVKMESFATFIIGNPEETIEDIEQTRKIAKLAPAGVGFLILVPYPGSPLYKMAIENKWFVDEKIIFDQRWTNKQSNVPVMQASFKADQLVKIRASLENAFFWRNNMQTMIAFLNSPKYLLRAIMTILGHPVFVIKALWLALRKGKAMDFLESIYQKFNQDLSV
ncbi:MAG: B12-binding domain-containing radical SAM protein [Candidatus Omnitrophica bacterium]|jgi:radical SAM superfamily enzyme YgiQ (UPF0313 family)|nr:B12-binding domain-containing radical SAM protein [Candidatus Omnitrophota bacterium]